MSDGPPFKHAGCGQPVYWRDGKLVDAEPRSHWPTHWKHVKRLKKDEAPALLANTLGVTLEAAQRALKAAGGDLEQATRVLLKGRGEELMK